MRRLTKPLEKQQLFSDEELLNLIDANPSGTQKEWGEELGVSDESVRKRLNHLGYYGLEASSAAILNERRHTANHQAAHPELYKEYAENSKLWKKEFGDKPKKVTLHNLELKKVKEIRKKLFDQDA
tara:strand:+ start:511 stop:888 length:378 start_codon:yes stop_codon:yes gene_type:complete